MAGTLLMFLTLASMGEAMQRFTETPVYAEVNPRGTVVMNCLVMDRKGQCRWEKDGVPVGLYDGKYEMVNSGSGDCSIRILDASMEYDNGVWQCQVTASDFTQKDTLISDGAQLVVRVAPSRVSILYQGEKYTEELEARDRITGRAGDEVELECVSDGGNPVPVLTWFLGDKLMMTKQAQENMRTSQGSWRAVSRLSLPVSREDNLKMIRCEAAHDALDTNLVVHQTLDILFPPRATARADKTGVLSEGESVVLSCSAESNPPSTVSWRRSGGNLLTTQPSFTIKSVGRDSAGGYECVAENILGLSEPAVVDIKVQYAPVILEVGPQANLASRTGEKITLTCSAEGSPPPTYQWLQQLPTGEVLVRGYQRELVIDSISYEHQGEFVCGAKNQLGEVQSDPVSVEVSGAPSITRLTVASEVVVRTGDDANIEVEFCSNPQPSQRWNLGMAGGQASNIVLGSNQRHGRFVVDKPQPVPAKDCYISVLRILGAHPADSRNYVLELQNDHGFDTHTVKLVVIDNQVSQEIFIAIVVGGILTFLLLALIVIYLVKADKCCGKKEAEKQGHEVGSDRTDVESCHSSVSNHSHNTVLPPDALYGTVTKKKQKLNPGDHVFNDSNEKLRPDLLPSLSRSVSPNVGVPVDGHVTTYNDLCFPKASNCGSMKRKKQRNQGVDCQLNSHGYFNYLNGDNHGGFVTNRLYE